MKAEVIDFIEETCRDEALIGAIESAMQRGARTDRSAGMPEAAARIAVGLAPNSGQQRRRDHRLLSAVALHQAARHQRPAVDQHEENQLERQ